MDDRQERFAAVEDGTFDVAIVGGGINGACLYDRLCRRGYRVLLLDKGDFAGGTSQASAMMIWGGLLYLKNLDFRTVYRFSRSRDRMIREMAGWVSPRLFRFVPAAGGLLGKRPVLAALYLYWIMGRFARRRPAIEADLPEAALLAHQADALAFEEAMLRTSDSRFVLAWIAAHRAPTAIALNYVELTGGGFDAKDGLWRLELRDRIAARDLAARARLVVNCAGVWTDSVNRVFGIRSAFKHVFSKGVFLGFGRDPSQHGPMIFEMGSHDDVITSIPWGPIELWGPTETAVDSIAGGFAVAPDDVAFLLERRRRCLRAGGTKEDIVSLRCGIRPLAVPASFDRDCYPLDLSRRSHIEVDRDRPWVSVYGGKITGCDEAAAAAARRIDALLPDERRAPPAPLSPLPAPDADMPLVDFPGLDEQVVEPAWSARHEFCCNLEDYLRRRTNIAQWVPREGLGRADGNLTHLRSIARTLAGGDATAAEQDLDRYRTGMAERFERVLERV